MASPDILHNHKMLVGLEIKHGDNDKAYVIHKVGDNECNKLTKLINRHKNQKYKRKSYETVIQM